MFVIKLDFEKIFQIKWPNWKIALEKQKKAYQVKIYNECRNKCPLSVIGQLCGHEQRFSGEIKWFRKRSEFMLWDHPMSHGLRHLLNKKWTV